jgi:hypothetical protein
MSRNIEGRLRKLEAEHKPKPRQHVIRGFSEAEVEQKFEALKASGVYQEGDEVLRVIRVIVRPRPRPDDGGRT